jgi:hypothetical protein
MAVAAGTSILRSPTAKCSTSQTKPHVLLEVTSSAVRSRRSPSSSRLIERQRVLTWFELLLPSLDFGLARRRKRSQNAIDKWSHKWRNLRSRKRVACPAAQSSRDVVFILFAIFNDCEALEWRLIVVLPWKSGTLIGYDATTYPLSSRLSFSFNVQGPNMA